MINLTEKDIIQSELSNTCISITTSNTSQNNIHYINVPMDNTIMNSWSNISVMYHFGNSTKYYTFEEIQEIVGLHERIKEQCGVNQTLNSLWNKFLVALKMYT